MNFLVDAQLPPSVCRWLAAHGHSATPVAALGLLAATDTAIAAFAERAGWTLTEDEDFPILRLPYRSPFRWLRLGNATNSALETWLEAR